MNDATEIEIEGGKVAVIPEWVLRAPFSTNAKVLYAAIARFGNESGRRMPGRKELSEDWLRCSRSSVSRAIAELEQYGAVVVRRSSKPARGARGHVITVNRYFLRTTDPTISVVMPGRPPVDYPLGHQRTSRPPVRHNRKRFDLDQTSTTNARKRSFKAVVAEIAASDMRAIGDLLDLAGQLRTTRRELGKSDRPFGDVHVAEAVQRALAAGCEARQIPDALIALASDPETRTPYRLEYAGDWWNAAVAAAQARRRQQRAADRANSEQAARVQAAAIEADLRATCPRCRGSGRTSVDVRGRTVSAVCSHQTEETA